MQDRRRGHRSRAGEHQANGGDRSRTRRRGTRHEARAESGQRLSGEAIGNLECEARVRVRGGPQRRLPFISRGGAGEGACWASQWAVGAPGRLFGPGRARAVPQARVAAQARPGRSGRAGPGPVATVPCRSRAGPKRRAVGRAASPRAAWPSIHATPYTLAICWPSPEAHFTKCSTFF